MLPIVNKKILTKSFLAPLRCGKIVHINQWILNDIDEDEDEDDGGGDIDNDNGNTKIIWMEE